MHAGIKGEVYLGACPEAMDFKNELKDFLAEEDFIVIDLGAFNIEEQAECGVLAREVGEKVVEGVLFNQDDYKAKGLMIFGILIDSKMRPLTDELEKLGDIKQAALLNGEFMDNEANMLTLLGTENIEDVKKALIKFYA